MPKHETPPPEGPNEVDALARFGRLASLGQSAESICQDLSDLLSAIQGQCDLACARIRGGAADDVRHVRHLASRCAQRVRRIIKLARGQRDRWSANLRAVLDRVQCDLSLHRLAEMPLHVDVRSDVRVACPPTQLQQVLSNLILFAHDTVGRGAGDVEVRARRCAGDVTIEIAHDGPGIPLSMRRHLFEPFACKDGHGLELYIARVIVQTHDGALGLFSSPERGTTFRVVLPGVRERVGVE